MTLVNCLTFNNIIFCLHKSLGGGGDQGHMPTCAPPHKRDLGFMKWPLEGTV